MSGRVTHRQGNRIYADVSGEERSGTMIIDTDDGRVTHMEMTNGNARDKTLLLNWKAGAGGGSHHD